MSISPMIAKDMSGADLLEDNTFAIGNSGRFHGFLRLIGSTGNNIFNTTLISL